MSEFVLFQSVNCIYASASNVTTPISNTCLTNTCLNNTRRRNSYVSMKVSSQAALVSEAPGAMTACVRLLFCVSSQMRLQAAPSTKASVAVTACMFSFICTISEVYLQVAVITKALTTLTLTRWAAGLLVSSRELTVLTVCRRNVQSNPVMTRQLISVLVFNNRKFVIMLTILCKLYCCVVVYFTFLLLC